MDNPPGKQSSASPQGAGQPVPVSPPSKPNPMKWVLIGCGSIVGLSILGFGGCVILVGLMAHKGTELERNAGKDAKASTERNSDPAIEARTLAADYKANEISADGKYKGRVLKVMGRVTGIKKDILDQPYVILKGTGSFQDVQCFFDKKHESELAALEMGSHITVSGKCDGLMMNVLLKKCSIVRDSEVAPNK